MLAYLTGATLGKVVGNDAGHMLCFGEIVLFSIPHYLSSYCQNLLQECVNLSGTDITTRCTDVLGSRINYVKEDMRMYNGGWASLTSLCTFMAFSQTTYSGAINQMLSSVLPSYLVGPLLEVATYAAGFGLGCINHYCTYPEQRLPRPSHA